MQVHLQLLFQPQPAALRTWGGDMSRSSRDLRLTLGPWTCGCKEPLAGPTRLPQLCLNHSQRPPPFCILCASVCTQVVISGLAPSPLALTRQELLSLLGHPIHLLGWEESLQSLEPGLGHALWEELTGQLWS